MPKKVAKGVAKASRPLGRTLRDARIKRGLSLRDVERMTGVAVSQLSRIELGARRNPGFATIARIAGALGISLDMLSSSTGDGLMDAFDDEHSPNAAKVFKALDSARLNAQRTLDAIEATGLGVARSARRR